MSWAFESSKSRLAARLVLLSIANHADLYTLYAWPSVPRIAQEANVSVRQAQRAIRELVRLGELDVEVGAGDGAANRYRLKTGGDILTPPPVTFKAQRGDKSGRAIRKNHHEPSNTNPPLPLPLAGGVSCRDRRNIAHSRMHWLGLHPPEECPLHPDSGRTVVGSCWGCYEAHYGNPEHPGVVVPAVLEEAAQRAVSRKLLLPIEVVQEVCKQCEIS